MNVPLGGGQGEPRSMGSFFVGGHADSLAMHILAGQPSDPSKLSDLCFYLARSLPRLLYYTSQSQKRILVVLFSYLNIFLYSFIDRYSFSSTLYIVHSFCFYIFSQGLGFLKLLEWLEWKRTRMVIGVGVFIIEFISSLEVQVYGVEGWGSKV